MNVDSIRTRVQVGTFIATALSITIAGIAVDKIGRARIIDTHRSALISVLDGGAIRACVESRHAWRQLPGGEEREWSFADGDTSGNLWFVRRAGSPTPILSSVGFPFDGAPITESALQRSSEPAINEVLGEGGTPYRVAGFTVTPADLLPPRPEPDDGRSRPPFREGPGSEEHGSRFGERRRPPRPRDSFGDDEAYEVFVAGSMIEELTALSELRRTLVFSGVGAVLLSALLISLVVRHGVAPLRALSRQLEGIDESSLGEEIRFPGAPAELRPIVSAIDSTRARLASAFERERRFTADAAHELRTPLAGLRATLEVALRRERSLETYREYADQCLAITRSMEDTLEGLLILARSEEIAERLEEVDVTGALGRAFGSLAPELSARQLSLQEASESDGAAVVESVAPLVERIASNLARNAAAYATPGTEVLYSVVQEEGGGVAMTVSNSCTALPPEASELAFEAFWRADEARTGEGEHVGLGLPLVAKAAEALGGRASIEVTEEAEGRSRFSIRVSLPRSAAA